MNTFFAAAFLLFTTTAFSQVRESETIECQITQNAKTKKVAFKVARSYVDAPTTYNIVTTNKDGTFTQMGLAAMEDAKNPGKFSFFIIFSKSQSLYGQYEQYSGSISNALPAKFSGTVLHDKTKTVGYDCRIFFENL